MLDLYQELARLVTALDARGIDYALCGGLAMAVWAFPRATVDIDILIEADVLAATERAAESIGYSIRARPMAFADGAIRIHRISKIDPAGGDVLMLDMMLVTPAIEDVWAGRVRVAWEEGVISVVSREGLAKLKAFRGSGIDQEDIRRLREIEP